MTPTSTNRWWAQRYSVNHAWFFYGNSGYLGSYNVYHAYRAQAVAILPIFSFYFND